MDLIHPPFSCNIMKSNIAGMDKGYTSNISPRTSGFAMPAANRLVKRAVIQSGLEVIALSGVSRILPSHAGRGVIFALHHVRPERTYDYEPNGLLSVTPEFLEEATKVVIDNGLTPVHLHTLPDHLRDSSSTEKFVCFTLDDGYRDNVKFAAPIFRKHKVPYTIFVTAGFVERSRTMWWETAEVVTRVLPQCGIPLGTGTATLKMNTSRQKMAAFERLSELVRTMDEDEAVRIIDQTARANGIDPEAIVDELSLDGSELRELAQDPLASIGAHTATHVNLKRVSTERLEAELQISVSAVEKYTARPPKAFAYPYGLPYAVGDREINAVRTAGFSVAVTTQPGVLRTRSLEKLASLNRVSLNGNFQKRRYVKALISGIPFALM
jgi:peptidoglycan/xylan/chitin deacetylase (PgdA/CDA1 family)